MKKSISCILILGFICGIFAGCNKQPIYEGESVLSDATSVSDIAPIVNAIALTEKPVSEIVHAIQAYNDGDYEDALKHLEMSTADYSKKREYYLGIISKYIDSGKLVEVQEVLDIVSQYDFEDYLDIQEKYGLCSEVKNNDELIGDKSNGVGFVNNGDNKDDGSKDTVVSKEYKLTESEMISIAQMFIDNAMQDTVHAGKSYEVISAISAEEYLGNTFVASFKVKIISSHYTGTLKVFVNEGVWGDYEYSKASFY